MTAILSILTFLFMVEQAAALEDKNLLVYNQNSFQTFENLWSYTGGYNDQGLKHEADPSSILDAGNFRTEIHSSWGAPHDFYLEFRSERGYIMAEMVFDVADVDVNNMSTWFSLDRLVDWFPHDLNVKIFNFTLSSDDRELLITETEANKAWFSIVHNSGSFDSAMVLAKNSTSLLTTFKTVTGIVYEGCYPDFEVSYVLQYHDSNSMTVDLCFLACKDSGHDHVGMQEGDACFCTSFVAKSNHLSHMCTIPCPGDTTQNCGGTNIGYWAMYSGKVKPNDLNNIVENNASGLLVNKTDNTYLQTNTTIIMQDELIWDDTFAYISNISVYAETATGHFTTYAFSFAGYFSEQEIYAADIGSPALEFSTNGSSNKIDTLPIFNITIFFKEAVKNSTVKLYGPSEPYVTVPHILLTGTFDDSITSSTFSTSSTVPSTATTSADTTLDSTPGPTSAETTSDSTTFRPTSPDTTADSTTSQPRPADASSGSTTSEPISEDTSSEFATSGPTSADTTSSSTIYTDTTSVSTTFSSTSAGSTSDSTMSRPSSTSTYSSERTTSSSTASARSTSSPATTSAVSETTTTSTTSTLTTTLGPYATCSANESTMLLINGQTYCPCFNVTVLMKNETVDIDRIVAELTVDKKQLSAYTRKFTSAEDNRPSAQTLGSLGVIVIVGTVGSIIYLDSASLLQELGRLRHNYKYLKRKLSKRISKVNILENIGTTSEAHCESSSGGNGSNADALPQVSG